MLLVVATLAIVFAPGQLEHLGHHEAVNASEMTAATLAPTSEHDATVAPARTNDLDRTLGLFAVAIATTVLAFAPRSRRRLRELRITERLNAIRLPAVLRGPPLPVA